MDIRTFIAVLTGEFLGFMVWMVWVVAKYGRKP